MAVGMWFYSRKRLGKPSWGWAAFALFATFYVTNKNCPANPDSASLTGVLIGCVVGNWLFFEVVRGLANRPKGEQQSATAPTEAPEEEAVNTPAVEPDHLTKQP